MCPFFIFKSGLQIVGDDPVYVEAGKTVTGPQTGSSGSAYGG
jgi:hypothetical protein